MSNVLEVHDLNKVYRDFSIKNVNFVLPEGCIAGFIGVNGAGKTTTIRIILGLTRQYSGSVSMFGQNMDDHGQQLRDRIGVVLDEGGFYNELTMAQMTSIIAPAYSNWSESAYNGFMDKFSLNPRQRIATLSKGMRMKYAITLALSHNADFLIMDEPTSGLDPLLRIEFLEIMSDFMKQGGKGVLFSTHITSDLDKVADILILIHDGAIMFHQDKDTLLDAHRLVKGDVNALNDENQWLFHSIRKTEYGFTGLSSRLADIKKHMPDAILERPSIEDLMLGYIEGGK